MAKRRKNSSRLVYILIGIVVVVLIAAFVGKQAGWIGKEKELEVELGEAGKVTIVEKVSASGMIRPVTEVKMSPDVPGEIIELNVEEGDSVIQDQLLVKIRPDNFLNAVERAQAQYNQQIANVQSSEASLARARATFDQARQEFERNKKLYEDRVISQTEWLQQKQNYEVAEQDLESALSNLEAAKYVMKSSLANLQDAKENLRLTNVYAPVGGIISKLSVEKGERVVGTQQMAGTEMMRIADLNKMEVRVDVNENDIIRVSEGDTALIDVDAYAYLNKEFKGIVTSIANTANEKTSSDAVTEFEVKILILNESYTDLIREGGRKYPFRPGMTASVDIITQTKNNVLAVPLSAVTTRKPENDDQSNENKPEENERSVQASISNKSGDVEVVFVNDNGIAKRVEVKTGISDYDNIEILEGLSEGQEVVRGPFLTVSKRLKDGDSIKPTGESRN